MKKYEIVLCLLLVSIPDILFPQEKKPFFEFQEEMRNQQQPPEKLIEAIGLKEGMTVADIGAGRGRVTVFLAKKVGKKGMVFANDIDTSVLDYLRDRCKKNSISNVKTIVGSTDDPLLPKEQVDLALIIDTFHHLEKPVEMMRNTKSCLKKNGILVIVDRDSIKSRLSPSEKTSREKLTKLSEEAGFKIIKVNSDLFKEDNIYFLKPPK
jgi:ubiquinone/menaquinone biosynthesis C-methylase UbiE